MLSSILLLLSYSMKSILRIIFFFLVFLFTNCTAVKEYQKMYLNDQDMELGAKKCETFEMNFETYREGASGANGGKVGGGCGCN